MKTSDLKYRLFQLGIANIPIGFICLAISIFYTSSVYDRVPLLLTTASCFFGFLNYYLLLNHFPKTTVFLSMINVILYLVCFASVIIIFMLFINNIFCVYKALNSKWIFVIIGFQIIDGTEHYILRVVNGKNEICVVNRNGKFMSENIGGATLYLIKRVLSFKAVTLIKKK